MKIRVVESEVIPEENAEKYSLNVTNIFNIKDIAAELSQYDISLTYETKRQVAPNIWALPATVSYVSKNSFIEDDKCLAEVFLYVDYENKEALAMSRRGADKQTMLLVSSVANKHIRKPFKFSKRLRDKV